MNGKVVMTEAEYWAKLEELSAYLKSQGYDISVAELRKRHEVAYRFPPERRHLDISFEAHAAAGSPEVLDRIIAYAPKGTTITEEYVRKVLSNEV